MEANPSRWARKDPRHWLVPWLTKNQARLERAIGMKIARPLDEPYGCGTYGCVYPLDDKRFVLKVSDDENEGPLTRAVIDARAKRGGTGFGPSTVLPGIVFYRNLFVDTYEGKPVYVVVREEIEPFTWDDVLEMHWYYHPLKTNKPTNPLDVTVDVIENFFDSKKTDEIEAAFEEWMIWVDLVGIDLPLVADAMFQLMEQNIVLRDVHWGNVGKTTVDWGKKFRPPGSVVIHDLGLTKTDAGPIAKLNPVGADEQRQKIVANLMSRSLVELFREHDMKALPSDVLYDGRQIQGWPDVWFTMQGETAHTKPWVRAVWKSTGETWTAGMLHGSHLREPHRVR